MSRRAIAFSLAQFVVLTFFVAVAGPSHAVADRDCGDFANQKKAQEFFLDWGGPQYDPHGLDSEGDGIACESNPCPCYYGTKPPASSPTSTPPKPVRSNVNLTASRSSGIAGERVRFVAKVNPQLSRPVVLQRKAGNRWVRVTSGKTTSTGRWSTRTSVRRATTIYRAAIPAVKRSGKRYTAATSTRATVQTLAQNVTLRLSDASVVRDDRVVATVSASPVRKRRPVVLQQRAGSRWNVIDSARENRRGKARFVVDTGSQGAFTYRAVVKRFRGAVTSRSTTRTLDVAPPQDTRAPGVPTGLVATAGDGYVDLDWTDVSASDLRGYYVYYATGAGSWTRLGSQPVGISSHNVAGLANGTEYRFCIASVDFAGNESTCGSSTSATPADTTPPGIPQELTAAPGDGAVDLDWSDVTATDLAGYRVYALTSEGAWALLSTELVTGSTYRAEGLANDTEQSFRVSAVDMAGNESPASEPVAATPTAPAAEPVPADQEG